MRTKWTAEGLPADAPLKSQINVSEEGHWFIYALAKTLYDIPLMDDWISYPVPGVN